MALARRALVTYSLDATVALPGLWRPTCSGRALDEQTIVGMSAPQSDAAAAADATGRAPPEGSHAQCTAMHCSPLHGQAGESYVIPSAYLASLLAPSLARAQQPAASSTRPANASFHTPKALCHSACATRPPLSLSGDHTAQVRANASH
jgi:hypothetical protein